MNWIAPELGEAVKDVPDALSLDIRIHITRADLVPALTINAGSSIDSDAVAEKEKSAQPIDPTIIEKGGPVSPTEGEGFKIVLGRPDLATLVKEEAESAPGPVSVNGAFCSYLLDLYTDCRYSCWTFVLHQRCPPYSQRPLCRTAICVAWYPTGLALC